MSRLVMHMRANAALNAPCPHHQPSRAARRTVMSCIARSSASNPHPAVNGIGAHSPSHPSTPTTPSAISATSSYIQNMDDVITVSDPLQAAYDKGFKAGLLASSNSPAATPTAQNQDSLKRSALKSVSWRVVSSGLTVMVAWVVFKDALQADEVAMLGGGEFMKFVLYLFHERAWSLVTLL